MPESIICTLDDVPLLLQDATERRKIDPDDPRGTGFRGMYPGLRDVAPLDLHRLLYKKVGLFRTIVDKPADDIWDQGWFLGLEPQDPKVVADVERTDRVTGIRRAMKYATRLARRDGKAFVVLRLRDATGDPTQPPTGVRAVLQARAVAKHNVQKIEYETEGDRAGQPRQYQILRRNRETRQSESTWYHWQRVIPVIQHPDEDDDQEGVSVLSWMLGDAQGFENVKWGAAETFARYGAPLYVLHIDKDAIDFDPKKDGPDVEKKLDSIRNNTTQRAWFKGATLTALSAGQGTINTPDKYAEMFMDALAGGSRIPKRELTGSSAGQLASASWDEKRYFNGILNDRENFGEPLLRTYYERLDEWGVLPGLAQRLVAVTWPPHLERTEGEIANDIVKVGSALDKYAKVGLPAPKQVWEILDWPESVTEEMRAAPLKLVSSATPPAVPPSEPDEPAEPSEQANARGDRLAIEFSEALIKVEDRFQRKFLAVLRDWWEDVEDALDRANTESKGRRRNQFDPEAALGFEFSEEALALVVEEALREAMVVGAGEMWNRLDRVEDIFSVVDTQTWPVLREFGRQWSEEKARAATEAVRRTVAEAISEGKTLRDLRRDLRDRFGVLENETVVARTEAVRGYNGGSMEAMSRAGVQNWEWVAFAGACPVCTALNGQIFIVGDSSLLPPNQSHPACRCTPAPVL